MLKAVLLRVKVTGAFSHSPVTGSPMGKSHKRRHAFARLWRVAGIAVRAMLRLQKSCRADARRQGQLTLTEAAKIRDAWLRASSAASGSLCATRGIVALLRDSGVIPAGSQYDAIAEGHLRNIRYREGTLVSLEMLLFIVSKLKRQIRGVKDLGDANKSLNYDLYDALAEANPRGEVSRSDLENCVHRFLGITRQRRDSAHWADAVLSREQFASLMNALLHENAQHAEPGLASTPAKMNANASVASRSLVLHQTELKHAVPEALGSDDDDIRQSHLHTLSSMNIDGGSSAAVADDWAPASVGSSTLLSNVEQAAIEARNRLREVGLKDDVADSEVKHPPLVGGGKYHALAFPALKDALGRPRQYTVKEVNEQVERLRARERLERPAFGQEDDETEQAAMRRLRPTRRQQVSRGIHYCVRAIPNAPIGAAGRSDATPTPALSTSRDMSPSVLRRATPSLSQSRIPMPSRVPTPHRNLRRPTFLPGQRADGGLRGPTDVRTLQSAGKHASLLRLGVEAARENHFGGPRPFTPDDSLQRLAQLALRCATPNSGASVRPL